MASGTWTYTAGSAVQGLDADEVVTDTYAFAASDSTTQTVTVTITGANDVSVWAGTIAGTLTEDVTCTACTGALTITDADDGDSPTITDVSSTAGANGYGTFVMASGTWTYTAGSAVLGLLVVRRPPSTTLFPATAPFR